MHSHFKTQAKFGIILKKYSSCVYACRDSLQILKHRQIKSGSDRGLLFFI